MSSALVKLLQHFNDTGFSPPASSTNAVPQYGMPVRFNPMIGFALAGLFSICFFTGSLCVYLRRYCLVRRSQATGDQQLLPIVILTGSDQNSESLGLDKESIKALPVFTFSPERSTKQGKIATECSVCLSEFQKHEPVKALPGCSHIFHPDCIDMWLFSHSTCPVCRCILLPISNLQWPAELPVNGPSPRPLLRGSSVPREVSITINEEEEPAEHHDADDPESQRIPMLASSSRDESQDSFPGMSFVPRVVRAYLQRSKSSPVNWAASAADVVESHEFPEAEKNQSGVIGDGSQVDEALTTHHGLRRAISSIVI